MHVSVLYYQAANHFIDNIDTNIGPSFHMNIQLMEPKLVNFFS